MSIATPMDFSNSASLLASLIPLTKDPHQAAIIAALDMPSPVDRIVQALEAKRRSCGEGK